jgi:acyl-CoA synthetase (AMP-forming)/AMP-acid ligase II
MPQPLPLDTAASILECLEHYARVTPQARAYTYLTNGDDQERVLTYGDLRSRAASFGNHLRCLGLSNRAVLLLFPTGLDFMIAFFACAYAGAVSVPANLARHSHHYARLNLIIRDSEAGAILTTDTLRNSIVEGLKGSSRAAPNISVLCESDTSNIECSIVMPASDQLAFLQYTSGSTGDPKGVMVTHRQLISNERAIQRSVDLPEHVIMAGWLPQFHDMGLIGVALQPLALGGHHVFMSPLHFLQRPLRWLKMISRYHAISTAAPNFALDLCVKAKLEDETEPLDLSSLRTLFCGAEPVNSDTVACFEQKFAPVGLGREVVSPCYGLAESTLMVSGGTAFKSSRILLVNRAALSEGRIEVTHDSNDSTSAIVCCGRSVMAHRLLIVDPTTHCVLSNGEVGEIWFAGPSVAAGYWGNSAATAATFGAMTADGDGPFMRTGDLGFLHNDGLFVTGRIKELIIFRGRNLYPHDIESTLIQAAASLSDVRAAVFSTDSESGAIIVAYVEMPRRGQEVRKLEFQAMAQSLRTVVSQIHEVSLGDIYFLAHGKIPQTSSGKTKRRHCAAMYTSGEIDIETNHLFSTRPSRALTN